MFKSLKWEDWIGVGIGAWLLASPWVVGYSDQPAATMNALVLGSVLVLEKMLQLGIRETAEEWIDVVAGVWLMIAPFALGFADHRLALVNAEAVGVLSVLFASLAMSPLDEKIGRWWRDHVIGR